MEKFEDTKVVIRSRILKNVGQYNEKKPKRQTIIYKALYRKL